MLVNYHDLDCMALIPPYANKSCMHIYIYIVILCYPPPKVWFKIYIPFAESPHKRIRMTDQPTASSTPSSSPGGASRGRMSPSPTPSPPSPVSSSSSSSGSTLHITPNPLPLPNFTAVVKRALRDGDSNGVWNLAIEQMMNFYVANYPNRYLFIHCSLSP